jgi:hypothetical protein
MKRHTVVGERILEVAPSLSQVAQLRRKPGIQFDTAVVEAFCAVVIEGSVPAGDGLTSVHGHS